MTVHAFTDGASRGNPGDSGIGILMKDGEVTASDADHSFDMLMDVGLTPVALPAFDCGE